MRNALMRALTCSILMAWSLVASAAPIVERLEMEDSHLPNPAAPREDPPGRTLSEKWPGDVFELEPAVLYREAWDRPGGDAPTDWWRRTPGYTPKSTWRNSNGVLIPGIDWSKANYMPTEGLNGSGAFRNDFWREEYGTGAPSFWVPQEQEHLFLRYHIKFDNAVNTASRCDGGKLPGWGGRMGAGGNAGDGRVVRGGHAGWSLRGGYGLNCPGEPGSPNININTYAYHGDMVGDYGDHWRWGSVSPGEWHCIESELIMNTPNVRNGILRGWIDGVLKFEKTDVFLRALPYDEDVAKGTNMAIWRMWTTLHHGGKDGMFHGTSRTAPIWLDQMVVATERIGCFTAKPPPPTCRECLQACVDTGACVDDPSEACNKCVQACMDGACKPAK